MKIESFGKEASLFVLCATAVGLAQSAEPIRLSVGNFRPLEAEINKFLVPIQRQSIEAAPMPISAEERAGCKRKT